ncbi:MAG: tail fiber protein [bacterium]|nr:tail fiber protein [bacterium]
MSSSSPPLRGERAASLSCEAGLDRSRYSELYQAIGTGWGTADSSHFNLPDLSGGIPEGAYSTV